MPDTDFCLTGCSCKASPLTPIHIVNKTYDKSYSGDTLDSVGKQSLGEGTRELESCISILLTADIGLGREITVWDTLSMTVDLGVERETNYMVVLIITLV